MRSLFLSKTAGHLKIHSELKVNNAPQQDSDGLHVLDRSGRIGIHLDTAWANYSVRDWLQAQGGFVFVPTYRRTHRYQSTTLTPHDPLIDQAFFPPAIVGGVLHTDKYWEKAGLSYTVYG